MVKHSITLTDEQHAFAKTLVDTGRYASVSAVIQQGIEDLRQRLAVADLDRMALCEILSRRRAGEFVGADEMNERLRRMLAGKRPAIVSDPTS
ncbi:MAG: type II toxin-antitoxin system ParD family antitoxin [Acidobacteriota bacterium]|nr:type II toxin-antitoxin system ParD family antitoxin [Acidobacteriota bacterium]